MNPGGLSLGPRSVERPADAGATIVAGIDGVTPVEVDSGGLVSPQGNSPVGRWSIDWWIGADDRWHLPAREPSVRQRRIGHGPIIETSLRVPSGDVLHTAYPVMVGGRSFTVIEVSNESPVPVALAIAIRPYSSAGEAGLGTASLAMHDSRIVTVGGAPLLLLPRKPNEAGVSNDQDLFDAVTNGQPLTWDSGNVDGPLANAVCLYPLPHATSLRFVVSPLDGNGSRMQDLTAMNIEKLPDSEAVVRGWNAVVDRAARFEFPEPGISALAGAARARLVMAAPELALDVVDANPGAGSMLSALAIGGHQQECRWSLDAIAKSFPTKLPGAAIDTAEVIEGVALAAELLGDEGLNEMLLEPVAQLTHLIERNGDAAAVSQAKTGLARLARAVGQHDASADLLAGLAPSHPDGRGEDRSKDRGEDNTVIDLVAAEQGNTAAIDKIVTLAELAAPAKRWSGPNTAASADSGATTADSALRAGEFWLAARLLLIREADSSDGLVIELLPEFPTAWRGGTVEVHQAPIAGLKVSFAIRWHGYRPALLWEFEGGSAIQAGSQGVAATTLRCPGLDPDWSTTEVRGETLLAGSADDLPEAPAPGDSFS